MAQYRTAQGKILDMGVFVAQHEHVRAVGNMGVNARGDTIDSTGKVVQSVNDKLNEYYGGTVTNPGATAMPQVLPQSGPVEPRQPVVPPQVVQRRRQLAPDPVPTAPVEPQMYQAPAAPQQHFMPTLPQTELSPIERELQESLDQNFEQEVAIEQAKVKEGRSRK